MVDPDSGASRAVGIVEQIGEQSSSAQLDAGQHHVERVGRVAEHDAALRLAFDLLAEAGIELQTSGLMAVGHRVVHGGNDFYRPTLVDDALIAKLKELSPLAPLHSPPAVLGIEVARKLLPDTPHVAVFDAAFFHNLPPRPRLTPSTAGWPRSGRSGATDSTAPRTSTSATRTVSRRWVRRFWMKSSATARQMLAAALQAEVAAQETTSIRNFQITSTETLIDPSPKLVSSTVQMFGGREEYSSERDTQAAKYQTHPR